MCSSPRALRASASTRSAISRTAAREKWGLPSPPRPARPARLTPSSPGPCTFRRRPASRASTWRARAMSGAVCRKAAGACLFSATAAVADFQPVTVAKNKIKKQGVAVQLDLEPAPDIIKSVADMAKRPFVVGFAAETDDVENNARSKLKRKKLDMIAANQVGDGIAFDCDDNALTVIWPGGKVEVARGPKIDVARQLISLIASRLPPPDGSPRRGARKRRPAALPRDRVRARRARR